MKLLYDLTVKFNITDILDPKLDWTDQIYTL